MQMCLAASQKSSRRQQAHSPSTSQRAVLWYTDSMTWLCTSRSAAILFREMKSWALSETVSIHRTDCVNIINLSKIEKDRLIEAEWQDTALMDNGAEYQADLKIFCHDRPGLLVDITKIFTEKEINISGIQSKTSKQGIATIEVFFNIKGRDQIKVLVEKLRQIESVIDVERTTG